MAVDLLEVHHEGERSADHQRAQDDVQDETKPELLISGTAASRGGCGVDAFFPPTNLPNILTFQFHFGKYVSNES